MAPGDPSPLLLGDEPLTLAVIAAVARGDRGVVLGDRARAAMTASRAVIDRVVAGGDASPAVYGVNTGFGALAEAGISPDQVAALQRNLVRSHAAGVGEPLPEDAVRAMMLLRAKVLAMGHSGVRPAIIDLLLPVLLRLRRRAHVLVLYLLYVQPNLLQLLSP